MKKLKKVLLVMLSLMVMFTFSACAKLNETVKIYSDGSALVGAEFVIDKKELFDYLDELNKEETGKALTQQEKKEFENSLLEDDSMKLVRRNGRECYVSEKQTEKLSNKALNKNFNDESTVTYIKNNVFYMNIKNITDKDIEEMAGGMGLSAEELQKLIKLSLKVEFPYSIKSISGGKISPTNNKVAVFEASYGKSKTLFATTSKSMTLTSVKEKVKELNSVPKSWIVKKSAKTTSINLELKKSQGAYKYQIKYSTNSNFANSKTKTVTSTKATLINLKKGTKYYVKVRAVKKNYIDKHVYSAWSNTTTITTAK